MTAGCNLHAVFRVPLLRPALLERGFFRGGADDPTDISSVLRGAGKRRAALTVGRRKNRPLTPDDVTFGSRKRSWWGCPTGHSWQAMIYTRSAGTGCPYCTGRKASPEQNCLAKQFPMLAVEWDSEKNAPLTPQDVTPGSHKLIWWRCQNGHSYRTAVKTRVQGSGCPYCVRKNVLPEETSLAAEYPALAKEWDAAKNAPLAPNQVLSGSRRKVWWTCANGHSWRAAEFSRTSLGTGCPVCTGKQALAGKTTSRRCIPTLPRSGTRRKTARSAQAMSLRARTALCGGDAKEVTPTAPSSHSACSGATAVPTARTARCCRGSTT